MIADEKRWRELCRAAGLAGDTSLYHEKIICAWDEPQRRYHTLKHLEDCLREFDKVRVLAHDPIALEFALWFHDVVYDPHSPENEEKSAVMAGQFLSNAGAVKELIARVTRLIQATKTHDVSVDSDAPLLMDIDLSILGKDSAQFASYETAIRQEYEWVPKELYCEKRAEILQGFLNRAVIFQTPEFRERYEEQARKNLAGSIRVLLTE